MSFKKEKSGVLDFSFLLFRIENKDTKNLQRILAISIDNC